MLDSLRDIKRKINFLINKLFAQKQITDFHIHPTAIIYGKKNMKIHKRALIAEYVIARIQEGHLEIGENSQIGPFTVIFSSNNGIYIGDNVMIAPHCVIAGGNHDYKQLELPMRFAASTSKGAIIIKNDVWIGSNCTITDGVTIGNGAVVAANSIVNKNVDPYTVVGGCPIKLLSTRL